MGFFEKVYDNSPVFFQNIMVSVKGYLNDRERYGKVYDEYRAFLCEYDSWTSEEKLRFQQDELVSFVNFAYKNSPFYREFYKDVDVSSIKTIADLKRLPILEKETLRQHVDRIVVDTGEPFLYCNTGGTTGKSLRVAMTCDDMMRRMAMLDHFKAKVGFEHRKMRRATFNGKHIIPLKQTKKVFWRYNAACKQKIYSSFHITEDNIKYYVEDLNRFKPQALDGFFSSMCDIAGYIERHNIKLDFTPIAIFPTSETLTDEGRKLLERVFGCKVYNQYASSEGAPFVNDCPQQKLHVLLASGVVEPFDEDEILVTSFTTHATPLIRYRIGDRMVFENDYVCNCGDDSAVVKTIEGRSQDYLFTGDGLKVFHLGSILKGIPNVVIHMQFVQEKKQEILLYLQVILKNHLDGII
jgi:phenylacetate-CoA ligase